MEYEPLIDSKGDVYRPPKDVYHYNTIWKVSRSLTKSLENYIDMDKLVEKGYKYAKRIPDKTVSLWTKRLLILMSFQKWHLGVKIVFYKYTKWLRKTEASYMDVYQYPSEFLETYLQETLRKNVRKIIEKQEEITHA